MRRKTRQVRIYEDDWQRLKKRQNELGENGLSMTFPDMLTGWADTRPIMNEIKEWLNETKKKKKYR